MLPVLDYTGPGFFGGFWEGFFGFFWSETPCLWDICSSELSMNLDPWVGNAMKPA